jgi:uncharacterized membrane protein
VILFLLACSPSEATIKDTDPCATEPVVDYNNFGQGFLIENCQSCHASTQSAREGAPEDIVFDTEADAWAWSDRILARAASEPPTMPPQGGTSAEDRQLLIDWLSCSAP